MASTSWLTILLSVVSVATAFTPTVFYGQSFVSSKLHPLSVNGIRLPACSKRCRATVLSTRMADATATLDGLISKIKEAGSTAKSPDKLFKLIKKANGAPSICVEFSRNPGVSRTKLETLSLTFRRSKAAAIVVDVLNPYEGGEEDFAEFAREQQTAKGNFPGPVPMVWRGKIKDINGVAAAAAAGASAVALAAEDLPPETLTELIHACHALGMEAFVEVTDAAHVKDAAAAGAKIICVRFTSTAAVKFLNYAQIQLRPDIPKELAAIATIPGRQGGGEIAQAQDMLQKGKFDGVLLSNFISDTSDPSTDRYVAYVMKEVLTKRSEQFKINEAKGGAGGSGYGQGWGAGAGRTLPPGFGGESTHK